MVWDICDLGGSETRYYRLEELCEYYLYLCVFKTLTVTSITAHFNYTNNTEYLYTKRHTRYVFTAH